VLIAWQGTLSANVVASDKVIASDTESSDIKVVKESMSEAGNVMKKVQQQLIQLELVELTDNTGLTYIGGKVKAADLEVYLSQMKGVLAEQYTLFRQHQKERDHHTFHMTLINPYEYKSLTNNITTGTTVAVSLRGLGQVKQADKSTFFVVVESPQAQKIRQGLGLSKKDFHVTLGFYPTDIYGVDKGVSSLIK